MSHADLLRRLFAAFAAGDADTIAAALAPGVRSHTPGDNRLAGVAQGRDAVLAQLRRSGELSDGTYRIEVQDVLAGDHHAAVVYRATGRRAERALDVCVLALYVIEDARITEIFFQPLDQPAFDAFWS